MKKNVRLTESDLTRIVRRVLMEEEGIVVVTKLGDYIEENKEGIKGEFEIVNGRFYIINDGRRTRVIEC